MKKLSVLLMSMCMVLSPIAVTAKSDNIHQPYITGYSDGTVRPNENITREEAAVILNRLVKDSIPTTKMMVFYKDLPQDRWSYNAVNILVNQNIVKGYSDGTFKPLNKITRAEAASMISRVGRKEIPQSQGKNDYKNHWAAGVIENGIEKGFIKGYEDGSFKPDKYVTRAEFINMVNHAFDRCETAEEHFVKNEIPKDVNRNDWYFIEVMDAVLPHKYEVKDGKKVYMETIYDKNAKAKNPGCKCKY